MQRWENVLLHSPKQSVRVLSVSWLSPIHVCAVESGSVLDFFNLGGQDWN